MADIGRTWIVLLRDVSHAVRVAGQDRVLASLVLHAETGLVLGSSVAGTSSDALAGAFQAALTRPAADLPPARPARVVCLVEAAADVRRAIEAASLGSPEVIEAGSAVEAEDIFDSLVGHLSGRAQPSEPPTSEDWALLVRQTLDYLRAESWARWSDVVPLSLQVSLDGATADYVAVVMGNAGIQHGLALYPGTALPADLYSATPGPNAIPSGTLLLFLDSPEETPKEFAQKAWRYDWPRDAAVVPAWVTGAPDRPSDLSRVDAQRLQVALAAVVALDSRRPVLVEAAGPVTGQVALAEGAHGGFTIAPQPPSL